MPKVAKWLGNTLEGLFASKFPLMTVINTEYITPFVKKICFQGDVSGMDFQIGYAIIIRVSDTEYRNYTVSYSDTEKGVVEIIVHLHGEAPGSRFMHALTTGEQIRISAPRGMKQYNPSVRQHVIIGDETSLGLAYSFLDAVKYKQHDCHFYLELDKENSAVPGLLGLDNYTVFPKNGTFQNESSVASLPVFHLDMWQDSNFVLTGNARSIQTVKRVLKQKNFRGRVLAKAYWMEGKVGL
ncbi:FAD-binding oxidoreductase [Cytophagaceae bacterium YF14B1]|uniref:FAD-binding oxidoreductase n=1 Tax=Xanthocytophaga flava TaxID=3048013 RepID=A0AAE3QPI0_9BACT|nr:FAD-binding oxidoreductase [Xanthocytophaga flavus]MDJ1482895.1 FAD-binding oxidoreductase [Xanthocytophaga flavus]